MDSLSRKPRHQRVRTGCVTCKARKIKCSEEHPFCQRCVTSGRRCGGYDVPQAWLFEPNQRRAFSNTISQRVDRSPSITHSRLRNAPDRRSFDLYIDQTVPLLSAYFGHSFWSQTLPQVAFHEPIVMCTVLAVSSLIESTELHYTILEDNKVYQSHYRNVIAGMTCDEPPGTPYVLMICLLLACCDFFRGNFVTGMNHVTSGARILDEWFSTKYRKSKFTVAEANLILAEIAPLFASILKKAPTYGVPASLASNMRLALSPSLELPYIPKTFSTIHQARHSLDGLTHVFVKLIDIHCEDVSGIGPLIPQLRTCLSSYGKALKSFETQQSPAALGRLAIWLCLFRAHHQVLSLITSTYPLTHLPRTYFKQYTPQFISVIDQYQKLWPDFELLRPSHNSSGPQWHAGFIPPLFFVATKCLDREIQTKAISYLQALKLQEKSWNSCVAAQIAIRLVALEEVSSCGEEHSHERMSPASESDREAPNWGSERVSAAVRDTKDALIHSQLSGEDMLHYACSDSLDWQEVTHVARRSGYQGATRPISTSCRCSTRGIALTT